MVEVSDCDRERDSRFFISDSRLCDTFMMIFVIDGMTDLAWFLTGVQEPLK